MPSTAEAVPITLAEPPEEVPDRPSPAVMLTEPPVAPEPADTDTEPPCSPSPPLEPADTEVEPAAPSRESPDAIVADPLEPDTALPLDTDTAPEEALLVAED